MRTEHINDSRHARKEVPDSRICVNSTNQKSSFPLSKKTSIFFVFLLAVIGISLLLPGFIGAENMNRIGIILNFITAFMVTPELIGPSKLQALDEKVKDFLQKYRSWIISNKELSYMKKFLILTSIAMLFCYGMVYLSKQQPSNDIPDYLFRIAPFAIVGSIILLFAVILIYLAGTLLNQVLEKTTKDGSFRSTLTWWGIIFFLVGNILQFIATF